MLLISRACVHACVHASERGRENESKSEQVRQRGRERLLRPLCSASTLPADTASDPPAGAAEGRAGVSLPPRQRAHTWPSCPKPRSHLRSCSQGNAPTLGRGRCCHLSWFLQDRTEAWHHDNVGATGRFVGIPIRKGLVCRKGRQGSEFKSQLQNTLAVRLKAAILCFFVPLRFGVGTPRD